MTYLTAPELTELTQAAIDSGLVFQSRMLLLGQLPMGFVASLPSSSADALGQFQSDLGSLNRVERLEDGSVPIVSYLQAGATRLRFESKPQAAVFERYGSRVGNVTLGIKLPSAAALPEVIHKQAIVHQDDTVAIGFLAAAISVGKSVGRISVPRFDSGKARLVGAGKPWLMNGSGWMIGADLFITNHHVINARENEPAASKADFDLQARGSTISFDFDTEASQTQAATVAEVAASDETLDYAILRVTTAAPRAVLALNKGSVAQLPSTYLPVNIIQHPRGMPKRIAFRNNLVSGVDDSSMRYFTDTDFGSSGSPVCDDAWRVLALHRGAIEATNVNFQGKDTAYVNFGTRIDALLADLQQRFPPVYTNIMASQPV